MLRILFTGEDLARLRFGSAPDPLWELVLSIHMLRGQPGDLLFTQWRKTTANALRSGGLGPGGRLLNDLTPTLGYFPDFLNPTAVEGLDGGLEAIRSTPTTVLARDLRRVPIPSRSLDDVRLLMRGDPATLWRLTDAMRAYHDVAVARYQPVLVAAVECDRRLRMHAMLNGGVRGLLASLRPLMYFSGDELRVPEHPDQVIHLNGRGLRLVPSYFCIRHPVTLFDHNLPPVLIYPAVRGPDSLLMRSTAPDRSLNALIGTTRSAILAAVGLGCSTTDLARRLGISAANASQHATILRNAGLITSHRDGTRMVHRTTALGYALLHAA